MRSQEKNPHHQCSESRYLTPLVEEHLPEAERTRLETHLETCSVCQSTLDRLADGDATAAKVLQHLRSPRLAASKPLQEVIARLQTSTGATQGLECEEPLRMDDFAVDYLHPGEDPDSLGRIGNYEITEVIGSGGMGVVLKGLDTKLNRLVAVKALSPILAMNSTARKRFVREAQAAAAVGHANVVTIYSVDEDRLPYLVMEFVDGPSLQQRLDSEGFLNLHQILRIGRQVAAGLSAAHAQGLVHRDIKPANILLESGLERVKLTDFGLARAADDASVTRDGTVVGTPQYMSPEQARGESVSQTSDLFSFGSVLYALATGRPPFRAESSFGVMRKITDEHPRPIRELNPETPDWLCAIIDRLMEKDKEARFQSATEVHDLLEQCLSHTQQPTEAGLPEIPTVTAPRRAFPTLKVLVGVSAMFTAMTGLLIALGFPSILFDDASSDREKGQPLGKGGQASEQRPYEQAFVVAFANPDEPGTLNVDIKRGSISVTGYDGDQIVVELSVPNFAPPSTSAAGGLKELRPDTLDFDVEESKEEIKLDGNSEKYVINLTIKVPRKTNLILDSYRDGVLQVKNVEGTFNLRSQNNDIRIVSVSGSGRLWSYNGSLSADMKSITKEQPLSLETYNGSIDLSLPASTAADLRYRSGHGKVLTDLDIDVANDVLRDSDKRGIESPEFVRGTLNAGGSTLTLETEKGDIRIRNRMKESVGR